MCCQHHQASTGRGWPRPLLYCLPQASGTSTQQRTGMWELTSGDNSTFQRRGRHHKPPSRDRALGPTLSNRWPLIELTVPQEEKDWGGKRAQARYSILPGSESVQLTRHGKKTMQRNKRGKYSLQNETTKENISNSVARAWMNDVVGSPVFHSRGNTDTWWPRSDTKHDNTRGQHTQ